MAVKRLNEIEEGQQEFPTGNKGKSIYIDYDWCKACGICIEFCPTEVYDFSALNQPATSRPQDCILCMICVHRCPDFAITIEPSSGELPEPKGEKTRERAVVGSGKAS